MLRIVLKAMSVSDIPGDGTPKRMANTFRVTLEPTCTYDKWPRVVCLGLHNGGEFVGRDSEGRGSIGEA